MIWLFSALVVIGLISVIGIAFWPENTGEDSED